MPDITKIDMWQTSGHLALYVSLSSDLLPGCGYLMLTRFKWSYWIFHGPEHLLIDRTIDECHGFSISKRFWHGKKVDNEWFRQKGCWLPFLEWAEEHASESTIIVMRRSLWYGWRWPARSKENEVQATIQIQSLIRRVRELG